MAPVNPIPSRAETEHPSFASLELIDEVSRTVEPDSPALESWSSSYVSDFRERFAFDLDYARELLAPAARIIEVGSSPPVLTGALARAGYDVTGIDLDPTRFARAVADLAVRVVKVDIECERWPFEDQSFEGALFFEVFEHLRINPIFTVAELNRVLTPGARVLLSTPNAHSLIGHLRYLLGRETMSVGGSIFYEFQKLSRIGHMGHVREYGVSDIIAFFATLGFETEEVIYRGHGSKFLPRSYRPFATYVLRKVAAFDATAADPQAGNFAAPRAGLTQPAVLAAMYPVIWASFLIRETLLRRSGRGARYPVVR